MTSSCRIRSWVSNYTTSIKILDQLHSTLCTSREVLPCLVDKINDPAKFSRYPTIDPKFALWVKRVARKLAAGYVRWIAVYPVQWQDGSTHSLLVQYIGFIYMRSTEENFVFLVHHIKRQLDLLNSVLVDALVMIIRFCTRVTFSYIIHNTYFYCDKLFFPSNIDCTYWLLHCVYLHHNVVYYAILALECLFKLHDFGTTTVDIYIWLQRIG